MKKTLVLALLLGGFAACSPTAPSTDTTTVATTATVTAPAISAQGTMATTTPVAYIEIDSLVSSYDLYNKLRSAYEKKVAKVEKELTSKGRSFEKDVLEFREKVEKGLVTRSQATKMEQTLQQKQQDLVKNRDALLQEMSEEEQVMLNNIQYNIVEYLKEFNSDKRYGVIISTSAAGPILNADPSLNITAQVLEGLNKKYASTKE